MIRVTITSIEYDTAIRALDGYQPADGRNNPSLAKAREKLHQADENKKISFTNKEANVLMDALMERDDEAAETFFEKLTGRVSS